MFKNIKQIKFKEDKLYNIIIKLSRNKLFYTKMGLSDTFQNRIYLIFLHISFLFIKAKEKNKNQFYEEFYQKMFDFIFKKIELNMREVGHGDMIVNKNMKFLVKSFYDILLNCQNYKDKTMMNKNSFLIKYLEQNTKQEGDISIELVDYFDKYHAFCIDLSSDSVLKGDLNFNYK